MAFRIHFFAKNINIGNKTEDHTLRKIAALQWFENNNYARFTTFLVKRPSSFPSKNSNGNDIVYEERLEYPALKRPTEN